MPDLRTARTKLRIAAAVMVILDVVAIVMLVTPLAGRESLRQDQLRQSWANLKARESAPWRGLDKKIPEARRDIEAFYQDRFPNGYSSMSDALDKMASESRVSVSSRKYSQKASELPGLDRVEIDEDVSGDYLPLVKFINTLERSRLFFIIDDMDLAGEQSGTVKLHIRLETYLRTT
jgi:type IV pilus assembly protein PilO